MLAKRLTCFHNFDLWYDLNDQVASRLNMQRSDQKFRLYKGIYAGLLEVTHGLSRQFPLKKKVFYFRGLDPFVDQLALQCSRDGFELVGFTSPDAEAMERLIEQVGKETLFVLLPGDDVFFGKLYHLNDLVPKLTEKRVFSISISHHRHRVRPLSDQVENYAIEMLNYEHDLALARLGARVRFADSQAPYMQWSIEDLKILGIQYKNEDQSKVTEFEKHLPGDFRPMFVGLSKEERLFDRAVILSESVDATAIIEYLCEKRVFEVGSADQQQLFETTSLTRWGGLRTVDWLSGVGLSPDERRGCLIISGNAINESLIEQMGEALMLLS